MQDVDRGLPKALGIQPKGTDALVLASPVSGSCLAGQLVSAVQGLQYASVVDMKQLTSPPSDKHASVLPDASSASTQCCAAKPDNSSQTVPGNGTHSGDAAEKQLRAGEVVKPGAKHRVLRLSVPEAQVSNGMSDHDSQFNTPTSTEASGKNGTSAVLSHPAHNASERSSARLGLAVAKCAVREPENSHTVLQPQETAASSPWPSLPSLSTAVEGREQDRDSTVRSSYEQTPTVQEMVHGTAGTKETPAADQSPSSGLLGMLVSMVSTSISPKRDESSRADSTFHGASSPNGAADDEEEASPNGAQAPGEEAEVVAAIPVLSPLNLFTPASPNGSTFDEK